ncbi:protein DCL homolog, chloroplastic-like [Panicum virgatum]|uniref:protein DCL homolog, chloroplastic-like n=1 Tax=Panicum virgatum TaxID=38727 RepID=UPI0019D67C68|nr:protein DCL homolog, chloroplastic-like [Panicum virgatum]
MALAAALARAATRLLRGGLPPAASAAASVPVLSPRIHRQLCGLPAADEPSTAGEADPWAEAEAEILRDVKPVVELVKDILHTCRYGNGGFLSPNDEKVVVEKLLSYHPRADEKIGCGIDGIMVDRHRGFRFSRCLFVVRTNGDWEDFSYRKCLQAYIKEKYPSYADRFLQKHLVNRSELFRVRK